MQLQAAGAGLPTSIAAGLPPGFLNPAAAGNSAAAAAAAAAAGLPGIPPGFLTGGLPPASIAAQMAAAGIRPPAGLPPVSTAGLSSAAELALRASREEEATKLALSKIFGILVRCRLCKIKSINAIFNRLLYYKIGYFSH